MTDLDIVKNRIERMTGKKFYYLTREIVTPEGSGQRRLCRGTRRECERFFDGMEYVLDHIDEFAEAMKVAREQRLANKEEK